MEKKKISLSGLGEVLSKQEMKNITGGSCLVDCGEGIPFYRNSCDNKEDWCELAKQAECTC